MWYWKCSFAVKYMSTCRRESAGFLCPNVTRDDIILFYFAGLKQQRVQECVTLRLVE